MPHQLRAHLPEHEVSTAVYAGFGGFKNGKLLKATEDAGYEVLLTGDLSLEYQQNLTGRKIAIVSLSANSWRIIQNHIPAIAGGDWYCEIRLIFESRLRQAQGFYRGSPFAVKGKQVKSKILRAKDEDRTCPPRTLGHSALGSWFTATACKRVLTEKAVGGTPPPQEILKTKRLFSWSYAASLFAKSSAQWT
jgi:hypothetical protein